MTHKHVVYIGNFYDPACSNNYFMVIYSTENTKLLQFIGNKPENCSCKNRNEQIKLFYLTNI